MCLSQSRFFCFGNVHNVISIEKRQTGVSDVAKVGLERWYQRETLVKMMFNDALPKLASREGRVSKLFFRTEDKREKVLLDI